MTKAAFLIAASAFAFALAPPAGAASLTIGSGNSNNAFPFGGSFLPNPTTYQQAYGASQFGAAPLVITGLSFRLLSGTVSIGNFTLGLSTTTRALTALDGANFASNVGADATQIYSGTLAGRLTGSTLAFDFAPFTYDPRTGNLLLNVNVTGLSGVFGDLVGFFAADTGATGIYSRATDFSAQIPTNIGLQTVFQVGPVAAAVPEPVTWATMLTGFGLVGAAVRRRRSLRTA